MTTAEFLAHLRTLDIHVRVEGGRVRCNAPKEVLTPDLREELAQRKQEILALLPDGGAGFVPDLPPLLKLPRNGPLPLSFSQQRLWFLDQLEPGSPAYNLPIAVRMRGPLVVAALEAGLNELVVRHESLRTTFEARASDAAQLIGPARKLALTLTDFSAVPEGEREAAARRQVDNETHRPFDLRQGPLVRCLLLRLRDDDHILLLNLHHIVADGWSLGVLFHELAQLYGAACEGKSSLLPEPSIQYGDYAVWQRQWLQGAELDRQLAYWKEQLADAPAILNLPLDRPRPARQTFHGGRCQATFSTSESVALNALAREEGVSLFMLLLAAFQLLLQRWSGQDDIVVGSPSAGRTRLETERVVGLFLNTLVLRTDLSGNPAFRELLGRVRETMLGAFAHQDLPFEKLVEELHPERSASHTPLFQVMLNLLNLDAGAAVFPGLTLEAFEVSEVESKFEMTLYVNEREGALQLSLVYNADLFLPERMELLLGQFQELVRQIVARPEALIGEYSLLTPAAAARLPDPTESLPEPRFAPTADVFLAQAERLPDQPAISHGERRWTYAELAVGARRIKAALQGAGVRKGDVVAVTGARSFGLISSLLATLSSGGVLLSLDRQLPVSRQELMLREARATHLLFVGEARAEDQWLRAVPGLRLLAVSAAEAAVSGETESAGGGSPPAPAVTGDDAAYIFFTSGTTGVPKAVLGCHKGLSHFLQWQRDCFTVGPGDRAAQLTGLSFDVVLRDIFLPLTSGATLCLPEADHDLSPDVVLPWMEKERITLLHTVPALAQSWLAQLPRNTALPFLRLVFFAGEPLTESLVRRWRAAFGTTGRVVNLYGPTETTLAKCFFVVPAEPVPGVQPVGRPLPQTQALILAENGRRCSIGEPGEIVLRTPFRSLGYANSAEETRRRFVPNPFRDDATDLLYHTGDRGRYRLDGSLDILGRTDDQVKVRGVRIELSEIAAVLTRHPEVKSAVVLARKDAHEQTHLVAYVVATRRDESMNEAIQTHLRQQLPAAMVPSGVVLLEALPLTDNGKVDRRRLPEPTLHRGTVAMVAPRTPVERLVAEIWCETLKLDQVGVHDNFFSVGGHSLVALQLFGRLRERFKTDLPVRLLFEAPTVAGLAERITQICQAPRVGAVAGADPIRSLTPIQALGSKRPLFLVPGGIGGEEEFLVYARLAPHLGLDQPFFGLKARGLDGRSAPHTDIRTMAADYVREIRELQPEGPYLVAGECHGGAAAYEMAQQLLAQGQQVGMLLLLDATRPVRTEYLRYQLRKLAANWPATLPGRILFHLRQVLHQPTGQRLAYLSTKLSKARHRTPPPPDPQMAEVARYKSQGDQYRRTLYRYHPRPYSGPVTIIGNESWLKRWPRLGWEKFIRADSETHVVPGDHFSYIREHVEVTAGKLRQCLAKVSAK